jgi:phosphate transport system substrate-binding protein
MKKKILLAVALAIFNTFNVCAQTLIEEFKSINESRGKRSALIDYLKLEGKVEESKQGTLVQSEDVSEFAKETIESENMDRLRQFALIARAQGKSVDDIAAAFAKQMGVDLSKKDVELLLRIDGSNTVGASLTPELVKAFLGKQGFSNIAMERNGVEATISFNRPGSKSLGTIEVKAHGSSTAFGETDESKSVGLEGGWCDIGMSSRKIKDDEVKKLAALGKGKLNTAGHEFPIALDGVAIVLNRELPIKSLTVEEVSKVFAGEIRDWSELGGPKMPITVYARDAQSGTWDTFDSRVLKPSKKKLVESARRFEDSRLLVRGVASDPAAIGFVGLAYVDSSVSGLAVNSAKGLTAFQPTRLSVKSQDYPLARLLYFYLPSNASTMARDFVKFTMSTEGQMVVDTTGLVGQGLSTQQDKTSADEFKNKLINDPNVPALYKNLVKAADRRDSQANIRFEQGSSEPDINSKNNLDRLASYLAESGNEKIKVVLIGFADSQGADVANVKLSEERAQSIADFLKLKGVKEFKVAGFGKAMPVADNTSESGRSQNRRVEVWLER